jgi:NitT/TauT family transport system substrate-binding protein
MVRTGEAQVGVASADRVLRENEGGAGLVIIGAATYKSPVVFLSRPDARVRTPADFSGRVIGIQTNTNTELVFKSLVNKAHIDLKRLHVVESGWGTQNFETGNIDVLAAFDYDEPVQLSMKGFRFTVLNPEDFGVKYVGTVYFTRRSLLDEHPDQVQAFMDNLVNGWREALAHRDEAIRKIRSRFKIDVAKERQSLDRGAPYFAGEGGRPLFVAPERWQAMAQNLIALHLLKSFRYADNVNFTFLEGALSPKAN